MRRFTGWRAASHDVAEMVHTTGPSIALAGAVACALVALPVLIRFWAFLSGYAS